MTRSRAAGFAGLGLVLHALLLLGALEWTGAWPRLAAAFTVLILLPGGALAALLGEAAGGGALAAPWALGCGVAWTGALILLTRALGQPFTVLAAWSLAASALLWIVAVRLMPERPRPAAPDPLPPLSRTAKSLVLLAAAFAAWHAWRLGTPVTYYTDSPDHVGTIRRMLEHGDAFPVDAFFRDAGRLGADPRKGLWHPTVALLCRLSGLDPFDVWRMLPALIGPFFVLAMAGLGRRISGSAGAAIAAWALPLTYGGSLASIALRETGLATKLADQLVIVTVTAALADLAVPAARTRLAVVVLALGAVAAHVFAAIHLALALGALAAGLLIRDRGLSPPTRRLAVTALLAGAACLPYLMWRARQAYGPVNPIHTEPQGLLALFDGARVVMPGVLWDWLGDLWVLFPLAWIPLWRRGRQNPAALWILTTSLAVVLVMFDPPVVAALEPRLGYLLMRFVWIVPVPALLAWWLPELVRVARQGRGGGRVAAAAALMLTLALLALTVRDGLSVVLHPARARRAEMAQDIGVWRPALSAFDRAFPAGQVVLADPATSYAIPAFTHDYVVTLVDQHSSPNDSLGLERLLDARDALDPYGSWERTREVMDRYGVTLVMINDGFREIPPLDYWTPSTQWAARARARLEREPAAFEPVFRHGSFTVFRVHRDPLARLHGGPRRPQVRRFDPERAPIARRLGPQLPALEAMVLQARRAAPGDTVRGWADWRALGPLPAGSYRVMVRFDRALPGGFTPPMAIAKPARKLIEQMRGERYRFRADHLPTNGAYGVDLWSPHEVVRDSFQLVVPADAAAGDYQVRVQVIRTPHYPNLRLSDYFSDADQFAGVPSGVFRVQRPGSPIPRDAILPDRDGH